MADSQSRLFSFLSSLMGTGTDGQVLTVDAASPGGWKAADAAGGGGWTFHEELTPSAVASVTSSAFTANPEGILVLGANIDTGATKFECVPSGTITYDGGGFNNATAVTTWSSVSAITSHSTSTVRECMIEFIKWGNSKDWWSVRGWYSEPGAANHHSLEGIIKLTAGSLTTLTFQPASGTITADAIQIFTK